MNVTLRSFMFVVAGLQLFAVAACKSSSEVVQTERAISEGTSHCMPIHTFRDLELPDREGLLTVNGTVAVSLLSLTQEDRALLSEAPGKDILANPSWYLDNLTRESISNAINVLGRIDPDSAVYVDFDPRRPELQERAERTYEQLRLAVTLLGMDAVRLAANRNWDESAHRFAQARGLANSITPMTSYRAVEVTHELRDVFHFFASHWWELCGLSDICIDHAEAFMVPSPAVDFVLANQGQFLLGESYWVFRGQKESRTGQTDAGSKTANMVRLLEDWHVRVHPTFEILTTQSALLAKGNYRDSAFRNEFDTISFSLETSSLLPRNTPNPLNFLLSVLHVRYQDCYLVDSVSYARYLANRSDTNSLIAPIGGCESINPGKYMEFPTVPSHSHYRIPDTVTLSLPRQGQLAGVSVGTQNRPFTITFPLTSVAAQD